MSKFPLIPLALVALLAVGGSASAAKAQPTGNGKATPGKAPPSPPTLTQNETRQLLYGYGLSLEMALNWPGLAMFLDSVAYTESRWKLRPEKQAPKSGSNGAVGPYQIRPRSGGDTPEFRAAFLAEPWFLEDPRIATAAEVAYLSRMASRNLYASWAEARASLAYPVFIHGRPTTLIESLAKVTKHKTLAAQQERYDNAVGRLISAVIKAGYAQNEPEAEGLVHGIRLYVRTTRYTLAQLLPLMGVIMVDEGGVMA